MLRIFTAVAITAHSVLLLGATEPLDKTISITTLASSRSVEDLESLWRSASSSGEKDQQTKFKIAQSIKADDWLAVKELAEVAEKHTDNAEISWLYCRALARTTLRANLRREVQSRIDQYPQFEPLKILELMIRKNQEQSEIVLSSFPQSTLSGSESAMAHYIHGALLYELGQYRKADEFFGKALEADSRFYPVKTGEVWLAKSRSAASSGDHATCIEHVNQAIKRGVNTPMIFNLGCRSYHRLGQDKDAAGLALRGLIANPNDHDMQILAYLSLLKAKNIQLALKVREESLRRCPENQRLQRIGTSKIAALRGDKDSPRKQ